MNHIVLMVLFCGIMALCSCSTEKATEPPQKIPVITLSPDKKEKLMAFQKDILSVESFTDKVVKLAGDELKNVITALLEYRKKSSQAQKLYSEATEKIKKIMTAAGVSQ